MTKVKNLLFAVSMVVLMVAMIIGCVGPKKAVKVLDKPKHELKAAEFCSTKFPVVPLYIKGDSIVTTDTLEIYEFVPVHDTTPGGTDTVYKKQVEVRYVNRTTRIVDTLRVPDSAGTRKYQLLYEGAEKKYQALFLDYKKVLDDRDAWKKKAQDRRWWIVILLAGIGVGVLLRIKKVI